MEELGLEHGFIATESVLSNTLLYYIKYNNILHKINNYFMQRPLSISPGVSAYVGRLCSSI